MVDRGERIDNQIDDQVAGWELALLLLGGFRSMVDEMHALLAQEGHPSLRPVHGFVLQAIGTGSSAADVAVRLGVSRQAATKTLTALEEQGYVQRTVDPSDARRLVVARTARGQDLLTASEVAFETVLQRWRDTVGRDDVDRIASVLQRLQLPAAGRLDLGAWSA